MNQDKENRQQTLRPFFIVGSPRSGTTLLRFMLSSHSRLYIPDETGFLPFLNCPPDRILDVQGVEQVLARIGRLNRFWRGLVNDPVAFLASLSEPHLPYLIDKLYRLEGGLTESTRWGDKTPLYVRYIPQILEIFPQAQFIHVVRDGRDATLSAYEKWGRSTWYMDHYYLLKNWGRNVEAGMKAGQRLTTTQYYSLRYESLVSEPAKALREVSDYLGVPFEPAMLEPAELAQQVGGGLDQHVEVQGPIHTQNVERWQEEMTSFQKKMANQLAGSALLALGYPLANEGSLSAMETLKIKLLALKFFFTDGGRSLLYRMGVLTLNKNRR